MALVLVFQQAMKDQWFALDGEKSEYEYSYNYQNWYPSAEYGQIILSKMLV